MKVSRSKGKGLKGKGKKSSSKAKGKAAQGQRISKQGRLDVNINHSPFVDKMNEVDLNFTREELKTTLKEIDELGKQLMKKPNMKLLEQYKENIHAFFKEALKKMYKVENKKGLERLGKEQKVYVNMTKIDEKLEELTLKFLEEQTDSINVIAQVDRIQGMLYDIIA